MRALPSVGYGAAPDSIKNARPELSSSGVEFKGLGASEIKADRSKRRVELWIAGYGNVDLGGDLIVNGAAADSIAEDFPRGLVKFYWDHVTPLGPCESIEEHKDGLLMVGRVTDHSDLDRYLAQIEDGTAAHGSLALSVHKRTHMSADELSKRYGVDSAGFESVRVIEKMRVYEGSAVVWPMNELVQVVGVRKRAQGIRVALSGRDLPLSDVVACLDQIRTMKSDEWGSLAADDVVEVARLLESMELATKSISERLEIKSSPGIPVSSRASSADLDRLIEAAGGLAKSLQSL